ncbi:DUF4169 family protein [Tropicimonas sediminicola]|uniref:DUF4169 domain-containing protein n=1 Tax=Tropicimonas sediminicola TaxID=1031541 RepID=A0A239E9W6_9RHOB|nr:DUF4169 family protein [Tropicimonas sediminicola]SNS40823.1 protein of unknown function [Tropicimonas sediminicola]
MADPINLNRFRKAKARKQAREDADRNSVLYGLPKAKKTRARAEAERIARLHEGGRREDGSESDETGD